MTDKPIHSFEGLKNLLKSKGFVVEKAEGYKSIKNEEIDLSNSNNNIKYTDEGIFIMDMLTGTRQQIFLYKRDYHLKKYGMPKFHIRRCQAIIDTGDSKYMKANTEEVIVSDMDDGYKKKKIRDLPLCKFCLQIINNEYSQRMTSTDFVEILKQAELNTEKNNYTDQEIDIFGYVRDWEQISLAYRAKKEFTCEKCGVKIINAFEHNYMHVHHRDGIKTNNKESNLECLCIRCHANVDDNHAKRFSTKANQIILQEFNNRYPIGYDLGEVILFE